jgi:hypothetical protein
MYVHSVLGQHASKLTLLYATIRTSGEGTTHATAAASDVAWAGLESAFKKKNGRGGKCADWEESAANKHLIVSARLLLALDPSGPGR